MSDRELLFSKLEECEDYKIIKGEREIKATQTKTDSENKNKKIFSKQLYVTFVGLLIILVVSSWHLQSNQKKLEQQSWYQATTSSINTVITILSASFVALLTVDLERRI